MPKTDSKQFDISFTRALYTDIPGVIAQLKGLTGIVTKAQITAIALRDFLAEQKRQKKLEERRGNQA